MKTRQLLALLERCRDHIKTSVQTGIEARLIDEEDCDGDYDLINDIESALKKLELKLLKDARRKRNRGKH